MKQLIKILLVGVLGMMTLASCLKTRNCECVTVYNNMNNETTTEGSIVMGFKSDAKAQCESKNSSNSSYTETCKLKK